MATSAAAAAIAPARADPARTRGLRRSRLFASLPEVAATPMPAPVEAVELLALQTRVRGDRVAAGELSATRLHDVRAFKSAYAELGYLRRLAAGGRHGGTVVTSMRQLVAGLAAIHPAWNVAGDGFEARDRHHQAVRRRLRDLEATGLLVWRIGVDLEGEERRTEIELLRPPAVSVEELKAATVVLGRWRARYGRSLNTGSTTGIRNAAAHGRPLTATERQRRGRQHTRQAAAARRESLALKTNSAPPSGASAPLQNITSQSSQPPSSVNACSRTGVTRVRATHNRDGRTALKANPKAETTGSEERPAVGGRTLRSLSADPGSSEGVPWDEAALAARVRAREAERRPVVEAIAGQAQARALEVAGWGLDRGWPRSRLREAWVVARWGASVAAQSGPAAAGPLSDEVFARLRRATGRYERYTTGRPDGWPAGGLAALLHLGMLAAAGELPDPPRLLCYAVGRLDQVSRRMRAHATAENPERLHTAGHRAQRRHTPADDNGGLQLRYRAPWPAWILLEDHTEPAFTEEGRLLLNERLIEQGRVPPPSTDAYRLTIRDAYLLAGQTLPVELDGRRQMALRDLRALDRAERPERPSIDELELRELAHRTGEPISLLRRTSPTWRRAWLQRQRVNDATQTRAEAPALRAQLADLHAGSPHAERQVEG